MAPGEQQNLTARLRPCRGSWLALPVAILANTLLFYILAAARTTPAAPRVDEKRALAVAIVSMPIPEAAKPEIAPPEADMVPVVSMAEAETEATALPETTAVPAPRLSGIEAVSAELPGLPVALPGLAELRSVPSTSVSGIKQALSLSGVDRAPRRIAGALPRVPQWARRARLEATVVLRFIVTAEGDVTDVNVSRIDGDERFGREAMRTVATWRFDPATKRGRPVACWCFQKVNFTLED